MADEKLYNEDGTRDWTVLTDWEEQIVEDMAEREAKKRLGDTDAH